MNYLRQLETLDMLISQKVSELTELKKKFKFLLDSELSEKVQTSKKSTALYTQSIEKIIDLQNEINYMIDEYSDKKAIIVKQILKIENQTHVQVLYKKYVEHKSLKRISSEMKYSYDRVRHLHAEALKNFKSRHTLAHFSTTT